jgi:hypothetical protein
LQVEQVIFSSVAQKSIVSTNNASKPSETDDAVVFCIGKAFIVHQFDFLFQQGLHQLLVVGLLLDSMRKEHVSFTFHQMLNRDFFDTYEQVAMANIVHKG